VIVRLESAAILFHSTNLRIRTRTSTREGLLGYVTFGPQAKGTVDGLPVRSGLMMAVAPEADELAPDRSDRARKANSLIVKIAEDYALSHADEHLSVSDLCRAAAVSERTLEYAFKQATGLRPMAYLIRLRLHRVRQVLLAGTPGSTTVSAAALNRGFWHFGEFSRAYKECFGELPSDTLRRKPGKPQR